MADGEQPKQFQKRLKHFLTVNLGLLLIALGIYFFKAPNGFATGGLSGVSILLARSGWQIGGHLITQAEYNIVLNILLDVIGVLILGKECGGDTIYCSLAITALNRLFEALHLIELCGGGSTLTDQPILELVYAIFLTGIGSGILFNCNASSGGTDILALIVKKYTNLDVGKALLCTDTLIALSTFFVFDVRTGLFAMIGLFAKVFVIDDLIESMNMYKAFMIVTTKPDEIDSYIFSVLNHSSTIVDAVGAYSGENRKLVITVCKRGEALKLRRRIKAIDAHSFMIITNTTEILGKGFRDA